MSVEILNQKYANTHVTLAGHQAMRFRYLLEMIREIMASEKIELDFREENNEAHYSLTPYSSESVRSGRRLIMQ